MFNNIFFRGEQAKKTFDRLPVPAQSRFFNNINAIRSEKKPFCHFTEVKVPFLGSFFNLLEIEKNIERSLSLGKIDGDIIVFKLIVKNCVKENIEKTKKNSNFNNEYIFESHPFPYVDLIACEPKNRALGDLSKSADLKLRSDLMLVIRDIISEYKWTQADASLQLKVSQPRVSYLVNGRIEMFSIDKLLACLYNIGFKLNPHYSNSKLQLDISQALVDKGIKESY